jgi:signal transduction histidine kinase
MPVQKYDIRRPETEGGLRGTLLEPGELAGSNSPGTFRSVPNAWQLRYFSGPRRSPRRAGSSTRRTPSSPADIVLRNARLLLKHVNDLLDASRLEAGKVEVAHANIDVAAWCGSWPANSKRSRAARSASSSRPAGTLTAAVDPERIQRVLLNLTARLRRLGLPVSPRRSGRRAWVRASGNLPTASGCGPRPACIR